MPSVRNLAQEAEAASQQIGVSEQDPNSRNLREELRETQGVFREVTGLQRSGLYLAWAILAIILVAVLVVGLDWIVGGPTIPDVPITNDEGAKATVENFKTLRDADLDRPRQLFTLVVTGGLVPLFTLLLGYIFGSQQARG